MKIKSKIRWQKVSQNEYHEVENFLMAREKLCVSASARFLTIKSMAKLNKRDSIWYFPGPEGEISSLIIKSRNSLFPVCSDDLIFTCPGFLKRFFIKIPIHSVQGLRKDAECLEKCMEANDYSVTERIDYELMNLDTMPKAEALKAGPKNLILRSPLPCDKEQLFALQSAYEKEEVLPNNVDFNPATCRYNLERILASERVLVAELDGQIVGKLNTNAKSFTRYQIGGVYVRPDYRSLGIASRMMAVFSSDILASGKGIALFSKSKNKAARKAYLNTGFDILADYRITYF